MDAWEIDVNVQRDPLKTFAQTSQRSARKRVELSWSRRLLGEFRPRDLTGNKFTKVVPEMFLGYVNDSDGKFTEQTAPLTQLKVIHLDLNPVTVVNEHAFTSTPSLQLIYLPFDVKIQRQAFAEMKTDKSTFDGYDRVGNHLLEDPHFVAFTKSNQ
ncbi:hypothetical protein PHYBOEH_002017 [Phytophthora boehmeriae]|uniref:Uncharacterized protein n=1 Tax=Phytophthora boehmeriae TaxID=109152 RepID=A0A8T1WRS0_9STRA|nr:hypothetical protein PHYBOEH_002017 [Phytophthora boehmeriae]